MKKISCVLFFLYCASVDGASQNVPFEQNKYLADNSNVSQIIAFGDSLLIKMEGQNETPSITEFRMCDASGNSLWPNSIINSGVGNLNISNCTDTSFFHMQIEDECDITGPNITFKEYNLEGNVIWQTIYDLYAQSNPYAPANIYYGLFIALDNHHFAFLATGSCHFFDRTLNDFTASIVFPYNVWSGTLRKDESALIAYSTNGVYEISEGGISLVSSIQFKHLALLGSEYIGITGNQHVVKLDDAFQVIADVSLTDNGFSDFVKDIVLSNNQVYVIGTDNNGQEHLKLLNSDLQESANWTLLESENYSINQFEVINDHIIIGGSNKNYTLDNTHDLLKSIELFSAENQFDENIGVVGFELASYNFYPSGVCAPPCFSCSFSGNVTVANFTDHLIENFSIHYKPSWPMSLMCATDFYTKEKLISIPPFDSVTFALPDNLLYTFLNDDNYGEMIDLTMCVSTMGPNDHLDDLPSNDEYCSTHSVLFLSSSEIENSVVGIYPNPSEESMTVQLSPGAHHLRLYDMTGHKIADYGEKQNVYSIQRESLSSGLYLLSVSDSKNGTTVYKVVFK